jgi:hypothetical protein
MHEGATLAGRRLLSEGLLTVRQIGPGSLIVAECKGDGGATYHLGFDPICRRFRCTCPSKRRCGKRGSRTTMPYSS